jgi:hypothetical protein
MCDMYRSRRSRWYQLSREMVSSIKLSYPCHMLMTLVSFANYGGTPAKAEYCHEGVSAVLIDLVVDAHPSTRH